MKTSIHRALAPIALLLLPGCGPGYRHTITPNIERVRDKAHRHTGYDFDGWELQELITEKEAQEGLTIDATIRNAVLAEPVLYANFEEIGVAKADLVQAGFFKNPSVDLLFQGPRSCNPANSAAYVDLTASMNISDFWQIPLKKKVARAELEIKTVATLNNIIETTADARLSYYTYLYELQQLTVVERILNAIKEMRSSAEQRYETGYISNYDLFVADAAIAEWEIKKRDREMSLYNATIDLRNTVGLELNGVLVPLKQGWEALLQPLPDPNPLFTYAERSNPELQIARLKIAQANAEIELVRSKVIDNVTFGMELTRDTAREFYIGPIISMDLPVFDQQQAQLERAHRLEKKAHRQLADKLADYSGDIFQLHRTMSTLQKNIETYQHHVIPATRKSLDYAQQHPGHIQINFSFFLSNQINLLNQEYLLHEQYLALARAMNQLEKRVGGAIPYDLPRNAAEVSSFVALRLGELEAH